MYSNVPGALRDGTGRLEVFAVHEIKWIKEIDHDKLEIRFPERILRLKTEEGEDIGKWKIAMEECQRERLKAIKAAKDQKLEHLAKNVKTVLLESSDDEGDITTESSLRHSKPSSPELEPGHDQSLGETRKPGRPPSPRSLLSNPTVGKRYVTPTSAAAPPPAESEPRHRAPIRGGRRLSSDDDEDRLVLTAKPALRDSSSPPRRAPSRQSPYSDDEDRLILATSVPSNSKSSPRPVPQPSDADRLLLDPPTYPQSNSPRIASSSSRVQASFPESQTIKTSSRVFETATFSSPEADEGDRNWLEEDWDADHEAKTAQPQQQALGVPAAASGDSNWVEDDWDADDEDDDRQVSYKSASSRAGSRGPQQSTSSSSRGASPSSKSKFSRPAAATSASRGPSRLNNTSNTNNERNLDSQRGF